MIFEIRDIWPWSLVEGYGLGNGNPLVQLLSHIERSGYRRADVVVGTMPNLLEHVRSVGGASVGVETVELGVDAELQEIAELPIEATSGTTFSLGYAGSLGRTNAIQKLLALAESFSDADGVVFDFFGKGDYLAEVKKRLIE